MDKSNGRHKVVWMAFIHKDKHYEKVVRLQLMSISSFERNCEKHDVILKHKWREIKKATQFLTISSRFLNNMYNTTNRIKNVLESEPIRLGWNQDK